jgi:hypothetical protein
MYRLPASPAASGSFNPAEQLERAFRQRDEALARIRAGQPSGVTPPMVGGQPAGGRVTTEVFTEAARAGIVPAPVDQTSTGFLERAGRFITATLSPLQLPQDIFFASLAGMMDRERTVMDYLGDMEWGNYTPWTPAPIRNVSGEQLLRMSGMQDGMARQVLGFGVDIFADPLFGGAILRGVAKVGNIASLNRVADVMDTVAESTMLAGALPTVRVAQAARKLPGFREIETAVVDNFVGKYVMPAMQPLLQADRTLPVSGRKFNLAGMFMVDGGRMQGARDVVARAGAVSEELAENTAVLLMQADAVAGGNTWKRMLEAQQRKMAVMYDIPINQINSFNPEVTRALMNSAHTTASDVGLVALRAAEPTLPSIRRAIPQGASPELRQAAQRLEYEVEGVMRATKLSPEASQELTGRVRTFQSERDRLMDIARRYGDDPDKVGMAFDEVVHRFAQVGALEGFFASGYGQMREKFFQTMAGRISAFEAANPAFAKAVKDAGGEARVIGDAWDNVLRAGPRGYAKNVLDYDVSFAGRDLLGDAGKFTYREMFGDYAKIPGLDLGDYIDSLTRGHMRRTFGMFQDENSWRTAVERLQDGKVASARILNEPVVYQGVLQDGFKAEGDLLKKYLDEVVPKTYGKRPVGAYVRQEDVMEHLVRQGVAPERAEAFWRSVMKAQDPEVAQLAERVAQYGRTRVTTPDPADVLTAGRKNLNQDEVDTLFELMNPLLSSAETSVAATSAARRMEGVTGIIRLAEQQGLIVDTATAGGKVPQWWRHIKGADGQAMPALNGKTVHPMVYREIHNLLGAGRNPSSFTQGLQRIRSMVSAGYLASPATTAANVAGGFWTAAQYGINPVKLMQNMFEVYNDWKRVGRDLPELVHTRDILEGGISSMDILRSTRALPDTVAGDLRSGVNALSDIVRDSAQKYENFLRKPFGQGALGLGLFQATESLFRLGTYRMVMKETGGNIQEARRAARFVVFDYASQPGIVQAVRDTGVFMFPAFPYFMVGRTIKAATERPGMLAAAERLPEAISRMVVPDENQRSAMLLGMEDWERDDKFIPIRRKENGDVSMLSLNQLLPTNTLTGAPFADSLKTLGLWGPMLDMVSAFVSVGREEQRGDPGAGAFTGGFGRRVLPTGVTDWTDPEGVLKGFGTFFYNSFAPAIARKLVRLPEDIQQNPEGIVPQLVRAATTVPSEWMYTGRTPREALTGRADQDFLDAVLSFGIRSTRNVITEGPLATGPRLLERAQATLQSDLNKLDQRIRILVAEGKMAAAQEQQTVRDRMVQRYWNRWGDYIRETQRLAQVGQFNIPQR